MNPRHNPFLFNVAQLAGGSAIGQAFVFFATPFLTRLYSPEEMGVFGIFMSFISFAAVGVSLRYDFAIVSARDKHEANALLIACIVLSIPTVTVASGLLYGMIRAKALSFAVLPGWSAIAMFIALFATGVFTALRFWYVGRKRFGDISLALVSQGAGRAAIPLILGWLSFGWLGLLCGEVLGRILGVSRLVRGAWPEIRETLRSIEWNYLSKVLKRYWRFPAVFLPSSLIDALATSLPLPVLSSLFGVHAAGEYFLVFRLSSVPVGLISAGVADVFHARIAEASRTDKSLVRKTLKNSIVKLALLGLCIYVPVALISPFAFGYVFGDDWNEAGILMTILALPCLSGIVSGPLSRALLVARNPEIKFLVDVVRLVLPIGGLWLGHFIEIGFLLSMLLFSVLTLLGEVFYMSIIWYAVAAHRQGHAE